MRIAIGLLFLVHGSQKLFGFPPGAMARAVPWLSWPAGVAGILEFFGGLLIVLGLFTKPAAFILSGQMAVAYFLVHARRGFWPGANGGELAILYCFVFFYLSAAGAGAWSLDALLARPEPEAPAAGALGEKKV